MAKQPIEKSEGVIRLERIVADLPDDALIEIVGQGVRRNRSLDPVEVPPIDGPPSESEIV